MRARRYYHGSPIAHAIGTVLSGRGAAYKADWAGSVFYTILEAHRPSDCLAHHDAVFMVDNDDDLDCAGGATDWVLELQPVGPTSRHDMNWSSEICALLSDGLSVTSAEVISCATKYWAGQAHPNESVWEYLCKHAHVLSCEPY